MIGGDFSDVFTLQPASLFVFDNERALVNPIVVDVTKKSIKLEFIHESTENVWAIPIREVCKIIVSIFPSKVSWVALKIPPLSGQQTDENPFPVIFTLCQTEQNLKLLAEFIKVASTETDVQEVAPSVFLKVAGAEVEDFLMHDLKYDDPDCNKDGDQAVEMKNPRIQEEPEIEVEEEISFTDKDAKVVVKFPNGLKKTISYVSLCKSLDDNGWFCDDLIDIAMEDMVQEKLSIFPQWQKNVVVYDTLFFPRISRIADELLTVNRINHPELMQLLYPLKNTNLMAFCECNYGLHRNVPDFKKELLVIPVCYSKHWLLVLVHRPMEALLDIESEYLDKGERRRCRIIILDSLEPTEERRQARDRLHEFIFVCIKNWLYLMHFHDCQNPNIKTGCQKVIPPHLPKQPNSNDCGIYLLKFFEEFVLEDWTWTDWPIKRLQTMKVKKPELMHEQVENYRLQLNILIRKIAVNLPKRRK